MKKEIELTIPPDFIFDYDFIKIKTASLLKINPEEINFIRIIKRSIDARKYNPVYKVKVIVYVREEPENLINKIEFKKVDDNKKVIIIGSGPAGIFSALKLIEHGIKPIIIERGKDVHSRRRDLKAIQRDGIVNPDSNYCFGEGGAGTYSDGKLYTRSTKRGNVKRILTLLVQHGAQEEILIDSHPHIGSNKLPKIVENIRNTILNFGGEIYFDSRVTDILIKDRKAIGVVVNDEIEFFADALIFATGHSARDIYYLLHKRNVKLLLKPYAVGVRIEHPQSLIDEIQYHSKSRHPNLPAASYNLACQVDQHGVYSFCMCPGGIIIPASTSNEELVLNGMSVSRRDSPYANSGLVVSVDERDWENFKCYDVFAGLEYQKEIERKCFEIGGKNQKAPAQRITDFLNNKLSVSLPKTSYIPGVVSAPLNEILPVNIVERIIRALIIFDKKMKGYITEEGQILAPETRTSSPIRIPRDKNTFMHIEIEGLFPCGEGAGYSGGIVSSAIDGEKTAEAVLRYIS